MTAAPTSLHLVRGNAVGTNRYGFGTRGGPYSFTTPQPPPGRHLLSIALCNDLHVGETTAGLVGGVPLFRGVSQEAGLSPYPEIMSRAVVEEARRRGADVLLAAGDISAGGGPHDLAEAKRILDGFGAHGRDYFVVRGNHDRPRHGHADGDAFRDGFLGGGGPSYFARDLGGLRIVGLDTYEKHGHGADAGGLGAEQLAWFRARLNESRDQPTVVFGHHPLTVRDSVFPVSRGSSSAAARHAPFSTPTPTLRASSSTTRATPTATSGPSCRRPRTSPCRRSAPSRTTPAVSVCSGSTPADSLSTTTSPAVPRPVNGASAVAGWRRDCGRTMRSAARSPTATVSPPTTCPASSARYHERPSRTALVSLWPAEQVSSPGAGRRVGGAPFSSADGLSRTP